MWYFKLKYQRIRALVKTSRKQLKVVLASEVKKLGLTSLALKLGKFPLFNGFLDLADFLPFEFSDLDNFRHFDNFLHFSINSSLSLLLPTLLAAKTSSATSTCDEIVVFSIDVSGMANLLKS